MRLDALELGSPRWLLPAAVLAIAAMLTVVWSYRRGPSFGTARTVAFLLKSAAIALLALCLLEPLVRGTKPRDGANLFAVVVDNSRSLAIADEAAGRSRADLVRELTGEAAAWQHRLGQDFEVRRYLFDTRLQAVGDFKSLAFDGNATSLAGALENLTTRYRDRPLAGILLLTDGNATDIVADRFHARGLPPIYPVVVGDEQVGCDVSLSRVTASQTNFEDAPVSLVAEIATTGCRGKAILVELFDAAGKRLDQQALTATDTGQPLAARFQLRPEQPGVSFYQVRVGLKDEATADGKMSRTREATLENNRKLFVVDRGTGPYRVLYVAGRPNWEYKFLRRAVDEDEQVQLVALLRIARREPKFDFRGRSGEATNPLFRGFDNQADETAETYDKPVLVRLGTEDAAELRDGFPKTADDLYRYQAIIVDDLEADFFTADQLALIQRFVSQRGGGFLMLGGQESFTGGKYERTPIGEMLPVYLDRLPETSENSGRRLTIEREGWLQPWVRLRATEAEERERLAAMPAFQTFNRVRAVKPGAQTLAGAAAGSDPKVPALVAQRFGKGRSLALMIGDLWRWGLKTGDVAPSEVPHDAEAGASPPKADLERAWRQTIRWLVADVPQRVEVELDRPRDDATAPLRIAVRAVDPRFEPLDNAAVTVAITAPEGGRLDLSATASSERAGEYEATYLSSRPGPYRAEVTVVGPDGAEVGRRQVGWPSDPAAAEFQALRPNGELLSRLARESGGEVVPAENLASFVADLSTRRTPITEPTITPLWHTPWVFLVAMLCLCGEWGLRRWKGSA